ncbi:MAG: hypothetical protein KAX49_06730 [Halanaerobiales bacterium]|nr:hypothetical protein [Halanaerobiales bacterium]
MYLKSKKGKSQFGVKPVGICMFATCEAGCYLGCYQSCTSSCTTSCGIGCGTDCTAICASGVGPYVL